MFNPTSNGRDLTSAPKKSFPWNFSTQPTGGRIQRRQVSELPQNGLTTNQAGIEKGTLSLLSALLLLEPLRTEWLTQPNCEKKKTVGSL
jgi:hypothetical protein